MNWIKDSETLAQREGHLDLDQHGHRPPLSTAGNEAPALHRFDRFLVEAEGRIEGTRELVIPRLPYIVIYSIVERPLRPAGEIAIMRVLHGARRWPAESG